MAASSISDSNVVELSPRRAQRNLRALREAQRRHPSYLGQLARERTATPPCRVLPFSR
ncbi:MULTISPECIES: hypothetical protein [Actinomycetes]|uniref:hypothetical protein n=1 Tax=Actinomycetes TaxID=1760 RepID=UPI0011750E48|nr:MULTISPECIES: hypothetical protein [Actinomycetes]MDO3401997.1 hypothetical protein [Mycolicibacterium neoaurum]TQK31389.1 hypothetical protein FBY28_4423 [Arthrobacter sp. SLBN-53]WBP96041.1 hypothetical protein O7W24_07685 [Mycolicibacterium neoaurum]WBS09727.1 hypothetical protein O6072_07680 [Mycolicibacterium neoaurum]